MGGEHILSVIQGWLSYWQFLHFLARRFQEFFSLSTVVSFLGFPLFNRTKICTNTITWYDLKYDYNILHTIFKFYIYGNSLAIVNYYSSVLLLRQLLLGMFYYETVNEKNAFVWVFILMYSFVCITNIVMLRNQEKKKNN